MPLTCSALTATSRPLRACHPRDLLGGGAALCATVAEPSLNARISRGCDRILDDRRRPPVRRQYAQDPPIVRVTLMGQMRRCESARGGARDVSGCGDARDRGRAGLAVRIRASSALTRAWFSIHTMSCSSTSTPCSSMTWDLRSRSSEMSPGASRRSLGAAVVDCRRVVCAIARSRRRSPVSARTRRKRCGLSGHDLREQLC